jgi:hypothetical protein
MCIEVSPNFLKILGLCLLEIALAYRTYIYNGMDKAVMSIN